MAKDKGISLNGDMSAQERLEKKKKKKRRKIVLTVILSVLAVFVIAIGLIAFFVTRAMKKMAGSTVTLEKAGKGDISAEINVNGTLESEKTIHYSAPATMVVAQVVPTGSFVKKGDVILKFDEESYAKALRQLEINSKVSANTYQSQKASSSDVRNKIAKAQADVNKYQTEANNAQQKVDQYQAVVDSYEKDGKLNKFSADVQTQIALEQANIAKDQAFQEQLLEAYQMSQEYLALNNEERAEALANFMKTGEYKALSDDIAKSQTVINNVSRQVNDQSSDYTKAQTELAKYKAEVETNKAKVEQAKAEVETYQKSLGNSYDRESANLQEELSTIQAQDSMDELLKYEKGLIAPFDGVVTMVSYTEGDTAAMGTPIITFSSLDDVHVTLGVGKSDLEKIAEGMPVTIKMLKNEYKGTITTINRSAVQAGNAGAQVMVTVSVDNPDDNIYLGLDAKCSILTGSATNVTTLPVEAVNIDGTGEFVFTFDPATMMVKKQYVTTGTSSDLLIEITEGINPDDLVVVSYTGVLEDGKMATPSAESMMLLQGNK